MDNLLIYNQMEEEHLKHLELVFEKLRGWYKIENVKFEFFKMEIEYLGHLVSGEGISPVKQKIKAITDLAPATNITDARCIIGLVGYYRKFFPIFSNTIRSLNELTRKNISFKWIMSKKFRVHKIGYYNQTHSNLPRPK